MTDREPRSLRVQLLPALIYASGQHFVYCRQPSLDHR